MNFKLIALFLVISLAIGVEGRAKNLKLLRIDTTERWWCRERLGGEDATGLHQELMEVCKHCGELHPDDPDMADKCEAGCFDSDYFPKCLGIFKDGKLIDSL